MKGVVIIKIKVSLIIFLFLIIPSMTTQANDGEIPYSVEAILPENQINNKVSYFDIALEPEENIDLEVIVYNTSDEEMVINVDNTTASTNYNGLITYNGKDENSHESMRYPFREISSIESKEVKVPPHDQETVIVTVKAPEESFDGIILGGIYFTLEPEEPEESEGVSIQNRYAYAVGVKIQETDNDNEVDPNLELLNVSAGLVNHRTSLQTEFANTSKIIINKLLFEGSVYEEGEDEPLYTRTIENFSIAPNSIFNFPVSYEDKPLEAGNYIFRANISNEDHSWDFEEPFEISAEVADKSNDEAVELAEEEDSWLVYLVISLAVVILILIIFVIYLLVKRKTKIENH